MITYVHDDLFQSPTQVLVNTVNTVGVMGKGIALQFKKLYPDMFKRYQELCREELLTVGKLWIYKTDRIWILNFPTKKHWRSKSKPEYIEAGLKKFVATYDERGVYSISFPMLGCGNGELDWETQVRPLMENYLDPLPIQVYIHIYDKKDTFIPEHKNTQEMKKWLSTEPNTLPFTEFWDDLTDVIQSQTSFETLGKNQPFNVSHISQRQEQQDVLIQPDNIVIEQDQFRSLWQILRTAGYCRAEDFPDGLSRYAPCVVVLLTQLDYIYPIRLSARNQETTVGLKLNPPVEDAPPVFERLDIVLKS